MATTSPPRCAALLCAAALSLAGCSGSSSSSGPGPTLPPPPVDPAAPAGFWDAGAIPQATQALTFVFLNRTGGKFADGEVYWRFEHGAKDGLPAISELHSIADR